MHRQFASSAPSIEVLHHPHVLLQLSLLSARLEHFSTLIVVAVTMAVVIAAAASDDCSILRGLEIHLGSVLDDSPDSGGLRSFGPRRDRLAGLDSRLTSHRRWG